MNRKKYTPSDYNKKAPFKDATKIFIIYEGTVKEPKYFEAFNDIFIDTQKSYVHHILDGDSGVIGNMPKNLKERAEKFIENPPKDIKVTPSLDDKYRFVLDVDKHPEEQIVALKSYCDSMEDSKLYISNYCFEVWLWFHLDEKENISATKSKEMKKLLGDKQGEMRMGAFPYDYMSREKIDIAIERAKAVDIDTNNYFPAEKTTKVYQLMIELLKYSIEEKAVSDSEIL